MNPETSAAVTAIATCVLAAFAFLAFVAAALTYWAQAKQLKIAKDGERRSRAPILRAEVSRDGQGFPAFRLDVSLLSHEPVAWVRVTIAEPRGGDCPLGFKPGQNGVEQHPDQDALPPGWRNDTLRHQAAWNEVLLPGGAATWRMEYRGDHAQHPADLAGMRLRAECGPAEGGEPWGVPVAVTWTADGLGALRQASGPDVLNTVADTAS